MKKLILLTTLAAALILLGCGGGDKQPDNTPGNGGEKIRIGIMPDAGALPILIMEGVEAVPFFSAKERDTAMQLGELDGMMTDLVGVVTFHQRDIPLKILTTTESRFMIVAHPDFTEDQTWTIGISENTVIEYMTDRWAEDRSVDKVSIPQVPVRMEMLGSGKIPLACLTDAMAWPLLSRDFKILRDQMGSGLEPAVLAFSPDYLSDSGTAIGDFRKGWNEAVEKINANPEEYRTLLMEHARIPEIDDFPYPMPEFRPVGLPGREQAELVLTWYERKFGWEMKVEYGEMIIP